MITTRRSALFALAAVACSRPRDALLIFAAASTTDALGALAKVYPRELRFSFGSSGDLARQIEAGAPADLFLSADSARVDRLQKQGHVRSRRDLLRNRLVVVVAPGSSVSRPAELASLKRIALGDPSIVPAGGYAKPWIDQHAPAAASKLVPVLDVRAALASVESGAADAAFVYRTDAMISKRVKVAFECDPQPDIVYPLAILTRAPSEAERFAEFAARQGRPIFDRYGFT